MCQLECSPNWVMSGPASYRFSLGIPWKTALNSTIPGNHQRLECPKTNDIVPCWRHRVLICICRALKGVWHCGIGRLSDCVGKGCFLTGHLCNNAAVCCMLFCPHGANRGIIHGTNPSNYQNMKTATAERKEAYPRCAETENDIPMKTRVGIECADGTQRLADAIRSSIADEAGALGM